MKLMCMGAYSNKPRGLGYEAGLIEVTEDIAAFLMVDAPGNFLPVVEEKPAVHTTAFDEPPHDTAMKHVPRGKSTMTKKNVADDPDPSL
jgi:hypothetical protein